MRIKLRGRQVHTEHTIFEEKQYTDIWTNDEYLQFMYERIILIRELLRDDGILALHCDWKKSHHLKMILDEIFGPNNFRGEVLVRAGTKNVQSQFETVSSLTTGHNSIFIYSKSTDHRLKKLQKKLDNVQPGKWDTFWRGTDRHTMRYELLGILPDSGQWRWEKNRATQAVNNYEIFLAEFSDHMSLDEYYQYILKNEDLDLDFVRLSDSGVVQYYVSPRAYKILSNVWFDLSYRGTQTNYPTEKHEQILDRLIKWLTDPTEIVFDCFMGSGTTQATALKLGRRFIGADINLGAIKTTTQRLININSELPQEVQLEMNFDNADKKKEIFYSGFEVYNVNNYDIFRNPLDAKGLLVEALEISRLPDGHLFDGEKDGRMVKIMPVNRIATRQDLNDLIYGFDNKAFEKRYAENPNQPVEKITVKHPIYEDKCLRKYGMQ